MISEVKYDSKAYDPVTIELSILRISNNIQEKQNTENSTKRFNGNGNLKRRSSDWRTNWNNIRPSELPYISVKLSTSIKPYTYVK